MSSRDALVVRCCSKQLTATLDSFPTHAVPLIDECLLALVKWHQHYKFADSWPKDFLKQDVVNILAPLALLSFKNRLGIIRQDRELNMLDKRQKNYFLKYLLGSRLVEQRNQDYSFPLETFREYFAAQAVISSDDPFAVVRPFLHRRDWQRVILYTAASLEEVDAARVDLRLPRITTLLVRVTGALIRIGASFLGRKLGSKITEEVLSEALGKEQSQDIQGWLQRWRVRSRRSVEFYITGIMRNQSPYERQLSRDLRLAGQCLGEVSECPEKLCRALVSTLIYQAVYHYRSEVLHMFLDCLSRAAGNRQACEYLLEATRYSDEKFRSVATHALRLRVFSPDVQQRLLQLTLDQDANVRKAATEGLRWVATDAEVRNRLLQMTKDPITFVRGRAAQALYDVAAEPDVLEQILLLMVRGDIPDRERAANVMRSVAGRLDVRRWLLSKTRDRDPLIRCAAAEGLEGADCESEVQEQLLQLTYDPDEFVRLSAATALRRRASLPNVQQRLLNMIDEEEEEESDTRPELIKLLREGAENSLVRQRLLALSRDADELVRRGTAEALQDLASNSEIRERLLQLTYDDDPFVAARAVSALQGALENIEVRSRLLALTRRGDSTVRTSAVAVLRALANTPEVQQLLLELMKESKESELSGMYSADLDEAAVEALRGCTPPFTLALIQPLARLVSYDREGAFETLDTMLAGISASPWTGRLRVNDV